MNTMKHTAPGTRRYVVTTPPAFFSDDNRRGINRVEVVGTFAKKGDALTAAQAALDAFRVCSSRVQRERQVLAMNPITGATEMWWDTEATVKEYSRYLKPEERLTPEEEASR